VTTGVATGGAVGVAVAPPHAVTIVPITRAIPSRWVHELRLI
jgi:predicted PurR-regulated permease PerM